MKGFKNLNNDFENLLIDLILYSTIWGIGGIICEKYWNKFNIFLLKMIYYDDIWTTYNL